MAEGFIVAGTDTSVGKTVASAMLVRALCADYYKPVETGALGDSDSKTVAALAKLSADRLHPSAYRFNVPLSPHRAAELEGAAIDPARLRKLPATKRPLIVELAGGLLVPLTRGFLQADLLKGWRLPVVLCARTTLGTINHTLLSLEALRSRGVACHGVAFIGDSAPDNEKTICELSGVRRLGRLPTLRPLTPDTLAAAFAENFLASDFGAAAHA